MANPNDIVYSRRNADGTAFLEKTLVPIPSAFIICGPCGDLTTFTGSITASTILVEATSSNTNYYVPFVVGSGSQILYIDTSSIYYNPELDTLSVPNISASLTGTASFATSASWAPSVGTGLNTGSTYPITSSWSVSASWAPSTPTGLSTGSTYPITSSWAVSASWAPQSSPNLSAYLSSSWTGSNTSQFSGTASFAVSASFARSASWAPSVQFGLETGSTYPITSSQSISSSFAISASWAPSISFGLETGSTYPITASWALTASFAMNAGSGLSTGSTYPITSSWAVSASWAPGGTGTGLETGSTYPITSSWAQNVLTASAIVNTTDVIFGGGYALTGSGYFNHYTSSYTLTDFDNGKIVSEASASATMGTLSLITVPGTLTSAFSCMIYQSGSGVLIVTGSDSSVIIRNRAGQTTLAGQYAVVSLIRVPDGSFILVGDTLV